MNVDFNNPIENSVQTKAEYNPQFDKSKNETMEYIMSETGLMELEAKTLYSTNIRQLIDYVQDLKIKEMMKMTSLGYHRCHYYLQQSGWNLEDAIKIFKMNHVIGET